MAIQRANRRVKVAFTLGTLQGGGAARVVIRLLHHLDRERFEPLLILFEQRGPFLEDLPPDVRVLACGRFGAGGRWAWFGVLVGFLRTHRPRVAVSFLRFTNAVAVAACLVFRVSCGLVLSERVTLRGASEGAAVEFLRGLGTLHRDVQVWVLGERPQAIALQTLARDLGVADRVLFRRFVHNPYPTLARATVFALPSRCEGFPNALLEAMALGLPCVAARRPTGPEEIITDGVDGLLVPVEDPDALAAAIARLLGDPDLRLRLGAAAARRAQDFDAPGVVRRFEALFTEVAG
ncbi:MAG: glycosyltransferase [Deferrisomatales bacterium]